MAKEAEIRLSLLIIISFFIHCILILGIFLPVYENYLKYSKILNEPAVKRDIIVNGNEDEKRVIGKNTLLSEKDSSAKGYITKEKGDQWLNNYRDFALKRGNEITGKFPEQSIDRVKTGLLLTDNTELIITLMKKQVASLFGKKGVEVTTKIPDKYSYTKDNAIFYSNDGIFSFNTKKFKPFKYFRKMKDKIAGHWYPPILANTVLFSYDPLYGYTPGRIRIMAIPNQEVKLYFTMNREGEVLETGIVDSFGNKALDSSCLDAIRLSKNFGKVPEEITGEVVVIRFVFIYVVNFK